MNPTLRITTATGSIGVAAGRLVPPRGRFDIELQVPGAMLHAGLINAHDHLHRNHYGRLGSPPYADAYGWGRDIHERRADAIAAGRALPRRDALLHGAWKNLLAGVTTVVHHDAWEADFDEGFPLRVVRVRNAHSPGLGRGLEELDDGVGPFCLHLAEGINQQAADEVRELDRKGLLNQRLLAVHVVGPDADGVARLRASGAAVVWCPTSNRFLFQRTAPAALLAEGIDVLLGSDSLLTGEGTLLDELRAAVASGLLSAGRLRSAVGDVAARRLGVAEPTLEPGGRADLVVLHRAPGAARASDVAAVVAGGVLRVLDPVLLPALGVWRERGRSLTQAGVTRWVWGPLPVLGPTRDAYGAGPGPGGG